MKDYFKKLNKITKLQNIALHKIKNGELAPQYMLDSENLTMDKWKNTHSQLHVKVSDDPVLKKIIKGEVVCINDIEKSKLVSPEFIKFGIKSILVYPLFTSNKDVFALIVIPSLNKKIEFTDNLIEECQLVINDINKILIQEEGI